MHSNRPGRTPQLHGLRLYAKGQIHFHVRVGFQPSERFNLRNDPARFLAAADFIRQSQFLSGLGEQSNGVDGVIGVATLLHGPNRDDRPINGDSDMKRWLKVGFIAAALSIPMGLRAAAAVGGADRSGAVSAAVCESDFDGAGRWGEGGDSARS